ncbi:hypothetical protein AB0D98_05535 [Streptomyces sp. NPDC047987]|uniref:hypothetical protein n=1 Tax=unclassified Streptomyces TaxID=2593676 RepID=UPI003417CB77
MLSEITPTAGHGREDSPASSGSHERVSSAAAVPDTACARPRSLSRAATFMPRTPMTPSSPNNPDRTPSERWETGESPVSRTHFVADAVETVTGR